MNDNIDYSYTTDFAENLFIGKDSTLSSDFLGEEVEVIGCKETPFGDSWMAKNKTK